MNGFTVVGVFFTTQLKYMLIEMGMIPQVSRGEHKKRPSEEVKSKVEKKTIFFVENLNKTYRWSPTKLRNVLVTHFVYHEYLEAIFMDRVSGNLKQSSVNKSDGFILQHLNLEAVNIRL